MKTMAYFLLTLMPFSAAYAVHPTTWVNYVDGNYYSNWYYDSGEMDGTLIYTAYHDNIPASVYVNFNSDDTYVWAKTVSGTNTCLYNGSVITVQPDKQWSVYDGTVI